MRTVVEQWAPEYGSPMEADQLDESKAEVDLEIEVPADDWAPRRSASAPARRVLFSDGVRRIDARAWLVDDDGAVEPQPALLASYAAGVVRSSDGVARLLDHVVGRGLFTPHPDAEPMSAGAEVWKVVRANDTTTEGLSLALQQQMTAAEAGVLGPHAADEGADLVVADGPLRSGVTYPAYAVGYVKTHATSYLRPPQSAVVAALAPGERTPVFSIASPLRTRLSWYLRLPGSIGHPWASVVRCEVDGDDAALRLADLATATIPFFASQAHKDPRAPQNLVPIGGLEQRLRHLLGDRDLLFRRILAAS